MKSVMVAVLCSGLAAVAQGTNPVATPKLVFEAASVKPMAPNPTALHAGLAVPGAAPGTRIDLASDLTAIIQTAYNLLPYQVGGEPAWADGPDGRFEIVATPPAPATDDELRIMLQNLLADRFKLQVKIETRDVAGYALVLDKGGARNLPESPPSTDAKGQPVPGARGMTMAYVATSVLKPAADGFNTTDPRNYLPVEDRTGLTGTYDFFAGLSPYFLAPANPPGAFHPPGVEPETITDLLSDRIGLRLVKATLSRPFLTVVHVERPAAN